ncbi:agamous-like MADS-box protein AGL62 [Silene latifolia]|uniref:agamous-like MADS-box protein AGL62 n=1 Tax=Silene latifolia TaxID=37657 RepID=UPI003D779EDA
MANVVPKKNKGRQKVKMERMEKDSNRQVTFSKRRSGLFKKASELCTLCGAEAAIIVFSPGKKAFSFGHPNVEVVLNRFMFSGPPSKPASANQQPILEARQNLNVKDLNMELTLMNSRIEIEKKKGEELSEVRKAKAKENNLWWDVPIEELDMEQLQHFQAQLDELKQHVIQHGNNLMIHASNQASVNPPIMGMINHPMLGFNHNPALFNNPNYGFGYNQDYNNY